MVSFTCNTFPLLAFSLLHNMTKVHYIRIHTYFMHWIHVNVYVHKCDQLAGKNGPPIIVISTLDYNYEIRIYVRTSNAEFYKEAHRKQLLRLLNIVIV